MREIEKLDQLKERLTQNLSDYNDHLLGFERSAIIEMAGRISATNDAHFYLTEHHDFSDSEIDFLLQFQNPLEIVADAWRQRTEDISDMSFALSEVFDKQDALQSYPLITASAQNNTYLQKFETTDLFAAMRGIVDQSIVHYPNDFNIDIETISKYALGDDPEKKMLLWHVSAYGTHLLPERDVFVKDAGAFAYWTDYIRPDMLAYAIEITDVGDDNIVANLYELNHKEHIAHVRDAALSAPTVTISYDDGRDTTVSRREYDDDRHHLMSESGNVTSIRFHPEDESVLASILRREQRQRDETPVGSLKAHVKTLVNNRINGEAERITAALKELSEPNSPSKTHFAVPLSHEFLYLASSSDQSRLLDALPFKGKALTGLKGEKGVFATVPKDELQKPSIRAQLAAAAKEVAARPQSPDQSKKQDKGAR